MNRLDRISAILIQLQSRKIVKAKDIADRFEISLRTVYRDLKTLETAGVPVIGEAGSGYSLMEGYRLPPIMFTLEEAMALNSAEKMIQQLTDNVNSGNYSSALYKVKAVLKGSQKDFIESMDSHIEVLKAKRQLHINQDNHSLQTILKALADKFVLSFIYQSGYNAKSEIRIVEPVGIFYLDNYWHLVAWCRLRNDYRDFRFDRISELQVISEKFTTDHPDIRSYLEQNERRQKLIPITIQVRLPVNSHFTDQKYYYGFLSESACSRTGWANMHFQVVSLEGFARWYLMFADQAQILEPVALKERVSELIRALSENN